MSLCGFCKTDRSKEADCGVMRYFDGFQAHHKCLQYSSGLVQYWGLPLHKEYGGFKPALVQKELKRANSLQCSSCKVNKKKDKKSPTHLRGASAGCAWKACKKSFHIPCAIKDPNAQVCRIVAKKGGRRIHLYRVYCGELHKERYEGHELQHLDEFEYNSDSDDNHEGEDEGEISDSDEDSSDGEADSVAIENGKTPSQLPKSEPPEPESTTKAPEPSHRRSSDSCPSQSRRFKKFFRAPAGRRKSMNEDTADAVARRELLESSSGSSTPVKESPHHRRNSTQSPAKKRKKASPRQIAISNFFTRHKKQESERSDESSDSGCEQMSPVIPYMQPLLMMDVRKTPVLGTVFSLNTSQGAEAELNAISDQLSCKSEDMTSTPGNPVMTSSPGLNSLVNGARKQLDLDVQGPTTPAKTAHQLPGPLQCSPLPGQSAGMVSESVNNQGIAGSVTVTQGGVGVLPGLQSFATMPAATSQSFSMDSSFGSSRDVTGVLCIMEQDCQPQQMASLIQETMGVNISMSKIHQIRPVKKAQLLYYLMDLAEMLSKGLLDETRELIVNLDEEKARRYKDQAELVERWSSLRTEAVSMLKHKSWERIIEHLEIAKVQHQIVGGVHCLGATNHRTLILMLTEDLDPERVIADHFKSKKINLHMWSPNTSILVPMPENVSKRAKRWQRELYLVSSWLENAAPENGFDVRIRPEEGILVDSEQYSTCNEVKKLFIDRTDSDSTKILLAILPVKKDLMNFPQYVQSVVLAFVEQHLTSSNEIYCMLDVGTANSLLKFDDILPDVPDKWLVSVFSAADPATHPVSCAVLHISREPGV